MFQSNTTSLIWSALLFSAFVRVSSIGVGTLVADSWMLAIEAHATCAATHVTGPVSPMLPISITPAEDMDIQFEHVSFDGAPRSTSEASTSATAVDPSTGSASFSSRTEFVTLDEQALKRRESKRISGCADADVAVESTDPPLPVDLTARVGGVMGRRHPLFWKSINVLTVSPYLSGGGGDKEKRDGNVLQEDVEILETACQLPSSHECPDMVAHLSYASATRADVVADVRERMGRGQVVVLDDAPPLVEYDGAGDPTGDIRFWTNTLKCNGAVKREFQDGRRMANDQPYVYSKATLREFCQSITQTGQITALMDIKPGVHFVDPIVEGLADGHQEVRSPSFSASLQSYTMYPAAEQASENWCLAHKAGFLTPAHHDAFGLATSIETVGNGHKMWVLLRFEDPEGSALTRPEILRRGELTVSNTCGEGASHSKLKIKDTPFAVKACVVWAKAGRRILQPPGQAHMVFTPVNCTTLGKQFMCYNIMHLTEYARSLDVQTKGAGTNQALDVMQHMIIHMAAALPARIAQGEKFRCKPLIGLCLMVVNPQLYISPLWAREYQGEALAFVKRLRKGPNKWVISLTDMLALAAAERVLDRLASEGFDVGPDYILQGSSWRDPGDEVACLDGSCKTWSTWTR
ncbi:hypothetical protein BD626DRAFT_542389 [Schizophyllum amplum]|uniref:JmjC domain-containing protein n=1 Tax=Schizophyllum amplum TaxID=97359 RepID=A0A550BSL4_9AGAR|nr:hypothetical protein BD626DRAFT_542389 [Auriculariopsis ampla]